MEKALHLIRSSGGESRSDFAQRIKALVYDLRKSGEVDALKYTITDQAPPRLSIIPFSSKLLASISVYQPKLTTPSTLTEVEGLVGSYWVEEAFPIAYERHWPDGEATPGVNLVTLFRKRADIDHDTFISRWHNGHTPLSLEVHPMWNYSRNVVKQALTDTSIPFDGIVEEQFRTRVDLLNPFRFFGKPLVIIPNMWRVYADVKRFLDYGSIETYLATEYHILSSKAVGSKV